MVGIICLPVEIGLIGPPKCGGDYAPPSPGSDRPDTIEACCTRHNVQIGNWKKDKLSTNSHKTAKHPQLYLIFICKTKQSSDILIEETTTI